jgi:hypothetical protein
MKPGRFHPLVSVVLGISIGLALQRAVAGPPQLSREQSAVLDSLARNRAVNAWPDLSKAQAGDLAEKADAFLANYQRYHQPFGLTADIRFSNHDRTSVDQLDGIGDAATWTGHYLASLAFKHSVTKDAKIFDFKGLRCKILETQGVRHFRIRELGGVSWTAARRAASRASLVPCPHSRGQLCGGVRLRRFVVWPDLQGCSSNFQRSGSGPRLVVD